MLERDQKVPDEGENIDAILEKQNERQQQLAEEFLRMTRAMKDNVTAAGHVIRDDNKVAFIS